MKLSEFVLLPSIFSLEQDSKSLNVLSIAVLLPSIFSLEQDQRDGKTGLKPSFVTINFFARTRHAKIKYAFNI